ncbi:MAG: carboxypeptidase regulatory-like domain-containing protein, partial [Oscillospiraceae bacterium]|nr:carboxypeptidase regulatory-like domain-containing protein [Oscillospiraceae bacterium]
DDSTVYYFTNLDESFSALASGDAVCVVQDDEMELLFEIDEIIQVDDETAMVTTSDDASFTNFYQVLKLDMEIYADESNYNVEVLDANADADANSDEANEAIDLIMTENTDNQYSYVPYTQSIQSIEILDIDDTSVSSALNEKLTFATTHVKATVEVSGDIKWTVSAHYDVIILGDNYFDFSFKQKSSLEAGGSVELKVDNAHDAEPDYKDPHEITLLPEQSIPVVPAVSITVKEMLVTEWAISGGITFDAKYENTSGFTYNTYDGKHPVDRKEYTVSLYGEATAEATIGPKITVSLEMIKVLKAELSVSGGVKIQLKAQTYELAATNAESIHACGFCVDGDVNYFITVHAGLGYEFNDRWKAELIGWDIVNLEGELFTCYMSVVNGEDSMFGGSLHMGLGDCPNKEYRTTVQVKDEAGDALDGITVNIKMVNGAKEADGTSEFSTYLYDGEYSASCVIDGTTTSRSFFVDGSAQTVVLSAESADGSISGKVCEAEDQVTVVADATVKIYSVDSGNEVKSLTTETDGTYSSGLTAGDYKVVVSADGYIPFTDYVTVEYGRDIYLETFLMISDSDETMGGLSGHITDAVTGELVSGATITISDGWNALESNTQHITLTTDESGYFEYPFIEFLGVKIGLAIGNYTLTVSKEGYITNVINAIVLPGIMNENQDGTLSPNMSAEGDYRVVLTWGATPSDLDSHLNAKTTSGGREHVYYGARLGSASNLDIDDTSSYGPETITVTDFEYFANGFTYSVHDYSNRSNSSSYAMSNSGAVVRFYQGETLLRTYNIPTGRIGTVWNVFQISADGTITDLNTFENISEPESVGASFTT